MKTLVSLAASIALLWLLLFSLTGCAATGWEPGPPVGQISKVPIPGVGEFVLSGERDTHILIQGIDGKHTKTWPSIQSISVERLATPPLNARGTNQFSIEQMRYEQSIANFERAANTLNSIAMQWAPLAQQYFPPGGFQREPNRQDAIKDELLDRLIDEIRNLKPTTQPSTP